MALARPDGQSIGSGPVAQAHGVHGVHDVQLNNSNVNVIGESHTHIHYHEIKDKLKTILDAISDYRRIQQDTLAKATPETVLWLLECEEFKLFVNVDGILKIMWGSGMPGAGKTIAASIVINRLEALAKDSNGTICVAYAYIRYSDQDQVTVRGILESLVKQTIERHPDCVPFAQQAYEIHLREGTRPTEDELHQLLSRFAQMKRATFYVLDALDEAPDGIRLRLIQRLLSIGVRLFVTSRPLPTLEARLPGAYTFPILAQDRDLELHIDEKVSSSEHLQDLLERGGSAFKEHLTSRVKSKCGGMFLHASLQLDALQYCFTVHDATQTLETFPQRIEDVYNQTWDRILKSDRYQAYLAKAAFAWVLNAQQSMTVDQLRHALATCPETYHFESTRLMPEAVILSACRGLIMVDKESELVRLVHYTAKEPLAGLLASEIPHPHSLLAAVCTTRLADCGFQNSTVASPQELNDALEVDPVLDYAYKAWVHHTRKSLDVDLTFPLVSAFITGCQTFPVKLPFSYGVDLLPALHTAAFFGLPLEYAGPYDIDAVNALSFVNKMTALHLACRQGHYATAQSLLCLPDVQVNLASSDGSIALMLASSHGHEGIVRLLLAHPDIQVNLVDSDGWTALMFATSNVHEGIVELLLAHPDIQVNLADSHGWTALVHASRNGHEGIVKLLLVHPDIQVNLADSHGWTALMHASSNVHEGIVKLLLAHPDIQVNLANSDGWTALVHASSNGYEGIVELLLAHPDIQVNLADPRGSTALLLASYYGHTPVVEHLLTALDIGVNPIDGDGDTAIKVAAEGGHEAIVHMLLNVPGIDTSIVANHDGHTALTASLSKSHHGIAQLLEDFEARRAATSSSNPVMTVQELPALQNIDYDSPQEQPAFSHSSIPEHLEVLVMADSDRTQPSPSSYGRQNNSRDGLLQGRLDSLNSESSEGHQALGASEVDDDEQHEHWICLCIPPWWFGGVRRHG